MNENSPIDELPKYYLSHQDYFSYILCFPIFLYLRLQKYHILTQLRERDRILDPLEVAENFLAISRDMYGVCKANNIIFYSVLQPFLGDGNRILTEPDKVLLKVIKEPSLNNNKTRFDFYLEFNESVRQKMRTLSFFYDSTGVFDNEKGQIFFDTCHFSDKGQKILADALYEIIKKRDEK